MSSLDSGGRKRTRDKDGKQRMLLEAAAEVFAECGYDEAATKEIARRANCSESLIFRYFGDKQGIFEKVVTHRLDEDTQEERDLVASHPDTIEEFLAHFFRGLPFAHSGETIADASQRSQAGSSSTNRRVKCPPTSTLRCLLR